MKDDLSFKALSLARDIAFPDKSWVRSSRTDRAGTPESLTLTGKMSYGMSTNTIIRHTVMLRLQPFSSFARFLRIEDKSLVLEWLDLHRSELQEDWQLAQERKLLNKIEPLE